jgi:hypothetical protein
MIQNTINADFSSLTTPRYVIVSIETMLKLKETVVIDSVKSAKYNLTVPKIHGLSEFQQTQICISNIIHKKDLVYRIPPNQILNLHVFNIFIIIFCEITVKINRMIIII